METTTIVASVLGLISFLGVIFNWTVVIANRQITSSKHSFGILTAFQAFGDAIHSTIFFIFVCPTIYLNNEFLMNHLHYAGYWLMFGYELSTQSHLLISFNRFCAVFYPTKYSTIFSIRNTHCVATVLILLALTYTSADYFMGCTLNWYKEVFLFNFPPIEFCLIFVFYTDFCKFLLTILLIQTSTTSADARAAAQRSREMSFLKQTCAQGSIFTCELVTYFILSSMIKNKWLLFLCTSFAWVSVHSLDGFVTLMFNQDMQKFIMKSILRKLLRMTQLPKSTQIVKVVPELRTRRLRARQIITSEMTIIP
ncbi:hypothetical protein B9Z55_018810 [Caenorhabditis nigoni]|uniref:7TM GPCR serpentine receptor class x (Srx) domain-containing protein n=1 Tax=Caenorhabditis nigoni TaxID=1611254 RepID=A0A2G5TFN4_9PELO|nr:hypothetical protein B9Z55_018810 [Caenorhabditis nigoni]